MVLLSKGALYRVHCLVMRVEVQLPNYQAVTLQGLTASICPGAYTALKSNFNGDILENIGLH